MTHAEAAGAPGQVAGENATLDPTQNVTGHPEVDQAMAGLAAVRDAPPSEQVGPLTEAQRSLAETLDTIGDV